MPYAELVELAGEDACSVCFPDAPVSVLNRPSRLSVPEKEAAEKARVERAKAKAERDAKNAEKAIFMPDGSPVIINADKRFPDRIRSAVSAKSEYKRAYQYANDPWGRNPLFKAEQERNMAILAEALKFKLGEEEFAVHHAKVEKAFAKYVRDNEKAMAEFEQRGW
jgi:hypothetical protein